MRRWSGVRRPRDPGFVEEVLHDPGQRRVLLAEREGKLPVRKLPQPQVGRRDAQVALGDGDAQRDARVGHDVQPLGLAPAGGAALPGEADQPPVHQLAQILVERGHADAAGLRERLPGAEAARLVERAVDPAAHGERIILSGHGEALLSSGRASVPGSIRPHGCLTFVNSKKKYNTNPFPVNRPERYFSCFQLTFEKTVNKSHLAPSALPVFYPVFCGKYRKYREAGKRA